MMKSVAVSEALPAEKVSPPECVTEPRMNGNAVSG
jgi:hypothetical protein